jgi:hypothetical protein
MKYIIIFYVVTILCIAYGMWTAPQMDENTGRTIKPGRKLSDLFKRNKK